MGYLDNFYEFIFGLQINAHNLAVFVFWVVFLFMTTVFFVALYHWRKYGLGGPILAVAETLYLAVSAVLILAAYFSLY